jgi:hypothetical protein
VALACALAAGAAAQETAGTRWPVPDVAPPKTELALEAYVTLSPAVEIGTSDAGTRASFRSRADGSSATGSRAK